MSDSRHLLHANMFLETHKLVPWTHFVNFKNSWLYLLSEMESNTEFFVKPTTKVYTNKKDKL